MINPLDPPRNHDGCEGPPKYTAWTFDRLRPVITTTLNGPPTLGNTPVTTGALLGGATVSVAAVVVAEPAVFVNTARYCVPLCAVVVAGVVYVVEVAPEMFVNVELPAGADCHCTVGVGVPVAAAVKVADCPPSPACSTDSS